MTKRLLTTLLVGAIAAVGLANSASAATQLGTLSFTGNYGNFTGTGNGPIPGVLSLQAQGNNTYEWGTSGWNGTTETWSSSTSQVHTNTTPSGYFAQPVSTLTPGGINASNFAVIFQVNVANGGDNLKVTHFYVDFIDSTGTTLTTLEYHPTFVNNLAGTDFAAAGGGTIDNGIFPGVGQGTSGWLFKLNGAVIPAGFFSNPNNRIGMHVDGSDVTASADFTQANDGSDNFFFTRADAPVFVPVPAAAWTGMSALAGLGIVGKLRKKLRRD
jgi:hypothetical protein